MGNGILLLFVNFIYLFMAVLGLRWCGGAFSACSVQASHYGSFSCGIGAQ